MSIVISRREIFVDKIYFFLQYSSKFLFLVFGVIGLQYNGYLYSLIGIIIGYLIGKLIRWNLGIRSNDKLTDFIIRMRERANGGRRSLLEYFLEKARGNEFTIKKCKSIVDKYDITMSKLQKTLSIEEKTHLLFKLDQDIKEISYAKE